MFTMAVAWASFVISCLLFIVAILDLALKASRPVQLLGVRAYFSQQMAVVLVVFLISGWYLFE